MVPGLVFVDYESGSYYSRYCKIIIKVDNRKKDRSMS